MLKKREEKKLKNLTCSIKKFIKNWIFEIKQKNLQVCTLELGYFWEKIIFIAKLWKKYIYFEDWNEKFIRNV